jgi:hypothetical protein
MTSDRAAKKAARARMAATGEAYNSARRTVQGNPPLDEIKTPSNIDPCDHAVHSRYWGATACFLVRHQGRYYGWITRPGGQPHVYSMRSEETGRRFVDDWQAANLLHTAWQDRLATLFLLDPADTTRVLYEAAVVNVADSGVWLACFDDTGRGDAWTLACFGDLGEAFNQFAAYAEQAADQIEHRQTSGSHGLIAAILRYRAATARTQAAAATLGDAIRHQAHFDDALYPAVHEAGISRELLARVLAGQELTWPQRPPIGPPGSRLPENPVRTLVTHTINGQHFSLVSYQDSSDRRCVGIDRDGHPSSSLCEVDVTDETLVRAGMTMAVKGQGIAAIYGRAHDSVTGIYAIMKDGQRVDWPIYDDPGNQQRYFAIVADSGSLADIVVNAPGRQVSLKHFFAMWFSNAS